MACLAGAAVWAQSGTAPTDIPAASTWREDFENLQGWEPVAIPGIRRPADIATVSQGPEEACVRLSTDSARLAVMADGDDLGTRTLAYLDWIELGNEPALEHPDAANGSD